MTHERTNNELLCGLSLLDESNDFTSVTSLVTCPNCLKARTVKYKGFTCVWNRDTQEYDVYTKDEMEQPKFTRSPDMSCSTLQHCKDFIDG